MSYIYQEDSVELAPEKISVSIDPLHGPTTIFHDVVIASEIVQPYPDGKALKCRDELEAYAWTVEGRWTKAGGHPEDAIISDRADVCGRTTNAHYVKNLKDPKTGRPNRAGVKADIQVFDKRISSELLDSMKKGKKRDVSIGFFFKKDEAPGKVTDGPFMGEDYDYVQRNMFHDHLAIAIDNGRCPSPYCGLGADEAVKRTLTNDPFAGFANWGVCIEKIMAGNPKLTKEQAANICGSLKAKHENAAEQESLQNVAAIAKAILCECGKEDMAATAHGDMNKLRDLVMEGYFSEHVIKSTTKQIDDRIKEILSAL
jgi:hypothetical protein